MSIIKMGMTIEEAAEVSGIGRNTMRNLMIQVQGRVREIRSLQDSVLPQLKQQLAETKGVFRGKERKALTKQIQQTEAKISTMLDALPDILKGDGYPDVRAFMTAYREAEAVVEQYNRDLAQLIVIGSNLYFKRFINTSS